MDIKQIIDKYYAGLPGLDAAMSILMSLTSTNADDIRRTIISIPELDELISHLVEYAGTIKVISPHTGNEYKLPVEVVTIAASWYL